MTAPQRLNPSFRDRAVEMLEASGYVVLKEKSYRAAQERQRVADALRRAAEDAAEHKQAWLERDVFPWERHLVHRVDHLAALAVRLGATDEQMRGRGCTCGRAGCAAQDGGQADG